VGRKFEQTEFTKLMLETIRCAILLAEEDGPESDIIFIRKLEELSLRVKQEKLDFSLSSREE
jgi:hypothetical protein